MRDRFRIMLFAGWIAIAAAAAQVPAPARAADPIMETGALLANPVTEDGSTVRSVQLVDDRNLTLQVYSAAMDKDVRIDVLRPADTSRPRPTLYLFNGTDAGYGIKSWQRQAPEVFDFLGAKNINVIQPTGGFASYYTDWRALDPKLGVNRWKTFFTEELPPLIDAGLGASGVNAIAGVSMSATAAMNLPLAKPGLFRAAAAYSGCFQTSDPAGQAIVRSLITIEGGNPDNMYGPPGDPLWAANDPYLHAEGLRGLDLFISSGNGIPAPDDLPGGGYAVDPGLDGYLVHLVADGTVETITGYCTRNMVARLTALGIPFTYDLPANGMHAWVMFRDELLKSWPVLAHGLGLPD